MNDTDRAATHKKNLEDATASLSRLSVLERSPEFAWFMRERIAKRMEALDIIIHDITKSAVERDAALVTWTELRNIAAWPAEQIRIHEELVNPTKA